MSRVFAGRESETGRPVVIKVVKPRENEREHLEREWRVLRAIGRARADGRLPDHVAPEAIARLTDPPALVLARMPGRRLDRSMSAAVRFPGRLFRFRGLVREFEAVVKCLFAVADVLTSGEAALNTPPEPLAELADRQVAAGAWEDGLAERVLSLAAEFDVRTPESGFAHGNFAPWNVLTGPAGVTLIDFGEARQPGHRFDDVAQMMIHIAIAGAQGGLKPGQARALSVALRDAARDGAGFRGRYLAELCRMHSGYTGAAPAEHRDLLRPRGDTAKELLVRFVSSRGAARPWG